MKVALLVVDNRGLLDDCGNPIPHFGTAPEALLQGFARMPELEVHVVSTIRERVRSPEFLSPNLRFHSLVVPKLGWMRTLYQGCVRATRRKLREIRPDIVHGQGTEFDGAISAVRSGFPNVITLHGNMAEMARVLRARPLSFYWLAARLETFAVRRTRGVFCNSAHTEDSVRQRAGRCWRVPNAVREQFFEKLPVQQPASQCVILNVGVICEYKRQLELLKLAESLHRSEPAVTFRFLGRANPQSPYARTFMERIKAGEREGYASYTGAKDTAGLIEAYDTASGMVHVPTAESFGLVAAEALARNLKFFGTRVGGIPDIAEGAEGAELFAEEDWAGLRDAITRWVRRGSPRPRAAAAIMRARYHPEVVARRHVEIYQEVLSSRS